MKVTNNSDRTISFKIVDTVYNLKENTTLCFDDRLGRLVQQSVRKLGLPDVLIHYSCDDQALTFVTTDKTLLGNGTDTNPLGVNTNITRDYVEGEELFEDEVITANDLFYRATTDFTTTNLNDDISSGNLRRVGGSLSVGYIDGRVEFFANLPPASSHGDEVYIVEKSSGIIFINKKKEGLYYSNGTDWVYMPNSIESQYIDYNNSTSGLAANNIQDAIDELSIDIETDETIVGTGKETDPLRVNRNITRDWESLALLYKDEIVSHNDKLYRSQLEFITSADINDDIASGDLVLISSPSNIFFVELLPIIIDQSIIDDGFIQLSHVPLMIFVSINGILEGSNFYDMDSDKVVFEDTNDLMIGDAIGIKYTYEQ